MSVGITYLVSYSEAFLAAFFSGISFRVSTTWLFSNFAAKVTMHLHAVTAFIPGAVFGRPHFLELDEKKIHLSSHNSEGRADDTMDMCRVN